MPTRVYNAAQIATARQLWGMGARQAAICRVMHITPTQFSVIKRTNKFPRRIPAGARRKGITLVHTPAIVRWASDLWKRGLSVSEIGEETGLGKNRISGLAGRNRDLFPPRPSPLKPRSA